jgi:hypothetical protein
MPLRTMAATHGIHRAQTGIHTAHITQGDSRMTHLVAKSAGLPRRSGRRPSRRHRWLLAMIFASSLGLGAITATAATRHAGRAHDTAAASAGHTANHTSTAGAAGSSEAPVWRCTDAHGTTRYSQQPCDGGTALTHLSDPRTAAQREQAADMLARDDKLLRRLGRERHHQAVLARDQGYGSLGPKRSRHAAAPTPDAHKPVPLQRCRPPNCVTARLPKDKTPGKAASPTAPSASS